MKPILIIFIVVLVLALIVLTYFVLNFFGYSLIVDLLHIGRPGLSDEQVDKLIQPIAPKGYQYPIPSSVATKRKVNCKDIYAFPEFPRTNPLCVNVFQSSAEKITQMLAAGSFDRLVLYAERSVFDAPTSSDITDNYIEDLFQVVKFMDQIAIPKFLAAYGLPQDVGYIKETKPYPYLYYRISSLDDSNKMCHYGDSTEKVQGCARGFFSSVIPLTAVGPQLSSAYPVLRPIDKVRYSYLTHYPADCFANDVFIHETAHLLNDAGQGFTGRYVMDDWLDEQIAGFFTIYGADLACGKGTVVNQNNSKITDVSKELAEFNSVFAPADLSHKYPSDDVCKQAVLTQWYRYLSKGDYRANFKQFFISQRASVPSVVFDDVLAKFLLTIDKDLAAKDFLISKGCEL